MPTLHRLRGQVSSARAAKILRKAEVHFDQVFHNNAAKDWSDLRDTGPTQLPALTMYGFCYKGLPAIKAFAKKEVKDREAAKHDTDECSNFFDRQKAWYVADG